MYLLTENVTNVKFNNEILQLIALICSLLTNISLLAIPLIVRQREESINNFKAQVAYYKVVEKLLDQTFDELRVILTICDSSLNTSEAFSPSVDKAEIAQYYQKIIQQIQDKAEKALRVEAKSNNR